jgi:hypothetical protein
MLTANCLVEAPVAEWAATPWTGGWFGWRGLLNRSLANCVWLLYLRDQKMEVVK